MEIFEGNKTTAETLTRVSFSTQPSDDSQRILKPCSEEVHGDGFVKVSGIRSEVLNGNMDIGGVEETEVSVVKMIQEDKEEMEAAISKNVEQKEGIGIGFGGEEETDEGFECSVLSGKKMEENEVQENESKGVFGNLVGDGSDDMKMKCSGNGISLVVDVKGSLGGENGSEVKPVFEDDSMEVEACLLEEKVKKQENKGEIFVSDMSKHVDEGNVGEKSAGIDVNFSTGEMGKHDNNGYSEKSTEIGESDSKMREIEVESGQSDGEDDASEEDYEFVVGDFVWGKIKSHPWWPGQIYDPLDASDYATKVKGKGRLLVAYFGDGSFSWCSPSQLKPFADYFEEMSKQSNSKSFLNAVQMALDEVGRLVEAELMCKCQTVDRIENPRVTNSGIKDGIPVPKGNTIKVLINRMEPLELLSILKFSATLESTTRMLELTVLRSCLAAFYRRKGGYILPVYHEPKCIEGLEDKIRSGVAGISDINGPVECAENADDKLYQTRKQKSVAELLGEGMDVEDEPKQKKVKMSKDVEDGPKQKKVKMSKDVEDEPKQKKVKMSKDVTPATKSSGTKRERKRKEVVSGSPENDGVEEETMAGIVSRKRKKSKYLSPPYTNPTWSAKSSGSSTKDKKLDVVKDPEMGAKQLEESSPPVRKSSGKKSHGRRRADSQDSEELNKTVNAAVNVNKVMQGLLRAALDPSYLIEKKYHTVITEFISSFRSSSFKDGSPFDGKRKRQHEEEKLVSQKDSPVTLVIKFPPAVSLPTKADLLNAYSGFQDLIEKETNILYDCSCAFVVFASSSDAQEALNMSLEKKPFGGANVKYQLRYPSAEEEESDLGFVKKQLDMMSSMVKRCEEGEMNAAEMKGNLEVGIKELLEKVSNMG